jgi:hypothetical protein
MAKVSDMNRIYAAFLALLLLFFGSIEVMAQRDEEINVKVGETKTASASGFRVNFVEVLEDSRCPKGANCIWAGRARIQIMLEAKSGAPITVELATIGGDDQSVDMAGYRIHLVKLDPHPSAEKAPEEKEYSAWFRFEKL